MQNTRSAAKGAPGSRRPRSPAAGEASAAAPADAEPGRRWRAAYASQPHQSRGRMHAEPESRSRSAFQRDRDRIIHSSAFRRLKHKTQVFVAHEGDHYRTRLTHTLEVAQIARAIALRLGLDEDLTEALALIHDLGHPPFGHAGEDALSAAMAAYGGFDHNAHTLRLVTQLEARYAEFDGLNLTWETLEGAVKHNGPLLAPGQDEKGLPWALTAYPHWRELELHTQPGPEAQVAALADDIAYNNHDLDDGLRAGLFTIEDLSAIPKVGAVFGELQDRYPGLETARLIHEAVRRLIGWMIDECVMEAERRLAALAPKHAGDVRGADAPVAAFPETVLEADRPLRAFLFAHMYRHHRVNRKMRSARRIVADLCDAFVDDPGLLAPEWRARAGDPRSPATARAVSDYIAGMTDRFAIDEHQRLFTMDAA